MIVLYSMRREAVEEQEETVDRTLRRWDVERTLMWVAWAALLANLTGGIAYVAAKLVRGVSPQDAISATLVRLGDEPTYLLALGAGQVWTTAGIVAVVLLAACAICRTVIHGLTGGWTSRSAYLGRGVSVALTVAVMAAWLWWSYEPGPAIDYVTARVVALTGMVICAAVTAHLVEPRWLSRARDEVRNRLRLPMWVLIGGSVLAATIILSADLA